MVGCGARRALLNTGEFGVGGLIVGGGEHSGGGGDFSGGDVEIEM